MVARLRAMTQKPKGGPEARRFKKIISSVLGARAERGSTRARRLLLGLLRLLRLLHLFRLLRFLSHGKSSQGSMDGNATRGMHGGGPPSQHPRIRSQQIRRPLPRTVTPVSSRYPQLLCIFWRFLPAERGLPAKIPASRAPMAADNRAGLMRRQHGGAVCIKQEQKRATPGDVHDFKTTAPIAAPQ
jgi:hypothetical protein